ncbi:MAG: GNAT family N-acetyltransferase, partial [Candidatus Heimdallarchaeota archaeon]|nr:GNAT family N-acetyltransferase [Candidatus Heimdallarchaeota archaeon]
KKILIQKLPEYIRGFLKGKPEGTFIPITVQRADAQAKNPLVKPDDVGLLVAYDGEEVVGFLGMVPQFMRYPGGHSIAWYFSGWNVSGKVAGRGVGRRLLKEAFALGEDFFLAGSKYARAAVLKAGMTPIGVWHYANIDINRPLEFNPITFFLRLVRKLSTVFGNELKIEKPKKRVDDFFKRIFGSMNRKIVVKKLIRMNKKIIDQLEIKNVNNVRLSDRNPDELIPEVTFFRSPELINWTLDNPWPLSPGESATEKMEYYFTDTLKDFSHKAYEIYFQKEYLGDIVISSFFKTGRKFAKVTDVLIADHECFFPALVMILQKEEFDVVELNLHSIKEFSESRMGKILINKKEKEYHYFVTNEHSPLKKFAEDIVFDVSDGDMGNT